jgi:hypothetical protein
MWTTTPSGLEKKCFRDMIAVCGSFVVGVCFRVAGLVPMLGYSRAIVRCEGASQNLMLVNREGMGR